MNGLATRLSLRQSPVTSHRALPADDLGLPNLREQRRRERINRIWRRSWRIGFTLVVVGLAFYLGYNTRLAATEARRRADLVQPADIERVKRNAMYLPMARRQCAMEWHENCLVCQHESLGGTVKSTMC